MESHAHTAHHDKPAWIFFVRVWFALSMILSVLCLFSAPVELWLKGYMLIGLLFTVCAAFMLARTERDNRNAQMSFDHSTEANNEELPQRYDARPL